MDKKYKTIIILFIILTVLLSVFNIYLFTKKFLAQEEITQENKEEDGNDLEEEIILEDVNVDEYSDKYRLGENSEYTVWLVDGRIDNEIFMYGRLLFLSKQEETKGIFVENDVEFFSSTTIERVINDRYVHILDGSSATAYGVTVIDLVKKEVVAAFCSSSNMTHYNHMIVYANCDSPSTPRPTSGPNSSIIAINLLTGASKTIYEADRETDYYIRQLTDAPTEAHVLIAKDTYAIDTIGTGESGLQGVDQLLNTEYLILDISKIEFD